ncbi:MULTISPECIES: PepSY domain-containing protein [Exiguobacterium]|uniref:PepSY-associated TM helix domain-containing protein n=1 Tax=Exiguobacterium TaxID=33986 RepID=UPI0005512628|nr:MULTISPECIES: PepSY domain-containing protein [Exiguobacterium]MCT4779903.1 PepSY domain-containing protein [Exiguobacterium soli]
MTERNQTSKKQRSWYQSMWRWHFYAGIIFAPIFIILAVTGSIYLFKPQIEDRLYSEMVFTEESGERVSLEKQVQAVNKKYPEATVSSIGQFEEADRTTRMGAMFGEEAGFVYVDPYTAEVTGQRLGEGPLGFIKTIHGELFAGKVGNLLVELAASWAIILLITGSYLFWPRGERGSFKRVLFPSFQKKDGARNFWKGLHGSVAIWSTLGLVLIIASGLAWSGVAGEWINTIATKTNSNFPQYAYGLDETLTSQVVTKDIAADIPWATQNDVVPTSGPAKPIPMTVSEVDRAATQRGIVKPYQITLPQGERGVYTISSLHSNPVQEKTMHFDQYSGTILSSVAFSDYGLLAKMISMGIGFHEGKLFGLLNQLVGLALCLGLIFIVISSSVLWWKRRNGAGKLTAPKRAVDRRVQKIVAGLILWISLTMPLAALSVVTIIVLDFLIFNRRRHDKEELAA